MERLAGLVAVIKKDLAKVIRFAAVAVVMVPFGLLLLWLFLQTSMAPVMANLCAVALSTIPNYLLNRYWVWQKRGANSVAREIAPFWAMAFLGGVLSTLFVWIANQFTDADLVLMAANFIAFGFVWVVKFFVLEKFMFGDHTHDEVRETTSV